MVKSKREMETVLQIQERKHKEKKRKLTSKVIPQVLLKNKKTVKAICQVMLAKILTCTYLNRQKREKKKENKKATCR